MQQHYFSSVLPLRFLTEQPVFKQKLNYPVIIFCFINFIPKFCSTMDTVITFNTRSTYQGTAFSIYNMCGNKNQACLFSVFNFSITHHLKLNIIPDSHCFYHALYTFCLNSVWMLNSQENKKEIKWCVLHHTWVQKQVC